VNNGHAKTREEAVALGNMLVFFGDVSHVTKEQHFNDKYLFYHFK
jgi:hypothetical protein